MKYPIGIQTFEQIVNGGYVYVDKTAMIHKLATEGKIYFLSRPRRFGKSLLLSTLKSYFLGQEELFKGLAIERLEKDWETYPVFHLDFNGVNFTVDGGIDDCIEYYIKRFSQDYGVTSSAESYSVRLADIFRQVHINTGHRVVVLVDEYDKPLLDVIDLDKYGERNGSRDLLENIHREVLKGLYSVFKSSDADLRFVFLTGVTKFSQVSVFSGFNQPQDISMDSRYDTLCGITEEEITEYFSDEIRLFADKRHSTCEEVRALLRKRYDGYHFSEALIGVYNPFSLLSCLSAKAMRNYWFATGTPTYLVRLLQGSNVNINEVVSKYYSDSQFMQSKSTYAEPLAMIYQSGYLTIKAYNERHETYLLDFPNTEVRKGFVDILASNYFNRNVTPRSWLNDTAAALETGDTETFHRRLTALLASITYRYQHKDDMVECERYFQLTFYLILQMIGTYEVYSEKETSEGRIDCVVETDDYVYVMELKRDGSAETALRQIEERGYARPYADDPRRLFRVGINFSSKTGNVEEFLVK